MVQCAPVEHLTADQIERAIDSWKPGDRRRLLAHLAQRYQKDFGNAMDSEDIERLGWMVLAQSSLGFWDNPQDAIYDRV